MSSESEAVEVEVEGGVCILNPTNPAVLNLCLPVPEEEATGRTHSAPLHRLQHRHTTSSRLRTFFFLSSLVFFFLLYLWKAEKRSGSSCEDAAFTRT